MELKTKVGRASPEGTARLISQNTTEELTDWQDAKGNNATPRSLAF